MKSGLPPCRQDRYCLFLPLCSFHLIQWGHDNHLDMLPRLFVATSLIFPHSHATFGESVLLFLLPQIKSNCHHFQSCRFLRTYRRNRLHNVSGRICSFMEPNPKLLSSARFRNGFAAKSSSFFRCKDSMQPGTTSGSLDQWRSRINLPLSSLAVLPAAKNKEY